VVRSIFITGATGNTGQSLLRRIANDESLSGIPITCLCRPSGRGERLLPFRVKIAGGDASNPESLKRVYQGQDTVILISSIFHAGAVLEGCAGMKRLIAVSSTSFYSQRSSIAGDIRAAEGAIERSGVPYTILRPTMIYGTLEDRNISRLIRLVAKASVVPLPGGGKTIFQPVHADDLAACILETLKSDAAIGKSYDVPGGSAHSLREIVSIISEILGKRILTVPVSLGLAEAAAGAIEKILGRAIVQPEQLARLREDKQYDCSAAARDLGYSPRSFREGVADEIRLVLAAGAPRSH
jgi:uncharacterized protein YbjT (DUF2867 family)